MDILNIKKTLSDSVITTLIDQFNISLTKIFEDIEKQYEIPKSELTERYLLTNTNEIIIEPKSKKTKITDKEFCCLARKQDGGQCTRRRKEGEEYCGKHTVQRKYGRIDDNEVICTTETTHIPENEIATWEIKFGEKVYNKDINNIVYDRDKIIGKLSKDGSLILIDENCKKIGKILKDGTEIKL
jgi:hypothetical protein